MIEKQQIGGGRCGRAGNFLQFATPDERRGIRPVAVLQNVADDLRPSAKCKIAQFIQRFFRAELRLRIWPSVRRRRIARCLRSAGYCFRLFPTPVVKAYKEGALLAHSGGQFRNLSVAQRG